MATQEDIAIGGMTGIYPLPGMEETQLHIGRAIQAAKNEAASLPVSRTGSPGVMQYAGRLSSRRPVGDDEYDQMVRHNALIKRLQQIEANSPAAYREHFVRGGAVPNPYKLREMNRPPLKYRPANVVTYPGGLVSEGLGWWDTTVEMPVSAVRMVYGNEGAADDFANAADKFLLGTNTFAKEGDFHPLRTKYEEILGAIPFDSPEMMQHGYADSTPLAASMEQYLGDRPVSTSDIMNDFGVPESRATKVASLLLDGLIDPDSAAVRAVGNIARRAPLAAARNIAIDSAIPLGLYGATEGPSIVDDLRRAGESAGEYARGMSQSAQGR